MRIEYGDSESSLNIYDAEEFPASPSLNAENVFTLPAAFLKKMIKQTVFACSNDETKPMLTGIFMEINAEELKLVSTDTHRLALTKMKMPGTFDFSGIIPGKTMTEILRLPDDDAEITISFDKMRMGFSFQNVNVITRLINGQFPAYEKVIPTKATVKIRIEKEIFVNSLERALIFTREDPMNLGIIKLELEDNMLKINHASISGKIYEQIEVEKEGNDLEITFNPSYLLDNLRAIETKYVITEFTGPYSAALFRPESDVEYLSLLVPVRN
jgi:DNA polymerase-3 subunit beta